MELTRNAIRAPFYRRGLCALGMPQAWAFAPHHELFTEIPFTRDINIVLQPHILALRLSSISL